MCLAVSVQGDITPAASGGFRIVTKPIELSYRHLSGDLHRHGELTHAHPHTGPHEHENEAHHHHGDHGHTHGLVHPSIKRSRAGVRAVVLSFVVLGLTALAQVAIFATTGSIALLADLIHNFGDAATAIPLGAAFLMRSETAERYAGYFVVFAIFVSAAVAGFEAIRRLIHPEPPAGGDRTGGAAARR